MLKKTIQNFEDNVKLSTHFILVLILSVLMVIVNNWFYINELLSHPQFINFDSTSSFIEEGMITINQIHRIPFVLFFVIDFIWAPITLYFCYRILKNRKFLESKCLKKTFIILGIAAIATDYFENICYLAEPKEFILIVICFKLFFYSVWFLLFLFVLIFPLRKKLIEFIKYSRVSLLFISIIVILITQIEMGGDIVITLFESPLNLILSLILIVTIAIPTAHYPEYFKIRADIKKGKSKYTFNINQHFKDSNRIGNRFYRFILSKSIFRIIYYTYNSDHKFTTDKTLIENRFNFNIFKRSTGILLFVSLIYIFLDNYQIFLDPSFPTQFITFLILLLLILFLYRISKLKKDANEIASNVILKANGESIINKFRLVVVSYRSMLFISIGLIIANGFVVNYYSWSKLSIFFTVFTLLILAITFILFVVCRSWFKYVYAPQNKEITSKDGNEDYINIVKKENINSIKKNIWSPKLYWFSDNINHLRSIVIIGNASLLFLLALNIKWQLNASINFINVLLMIYLVYYGLFVLYIKHRMYVKQFSSNKIAQTYFEENKLKNLYRSWKYYIPIALTFFALMAIFSLIKGNKLHYIQRVAINKTINIGTLKSKIENQKKSLFISSYGGGLKSNLWTLLNLNYLENTLEKENISFFNNVACLSGVSGGAVGFANYMLLDLDSLKRSNQIDNIAKYNFVTLDMTFLSGRDLLQEYFPFAFFKGKDRAFYGMKQHLIALNNDKKQSFENKFDQISFYSAYHTNFKSRGYFPPLITNTISTTGKQGIAFSIPIEDDSKFGAIFPGAINILNFDTKSQKSLHYLGAVSSANRFPILSPSASIEGKGHFIDGGAFDNSGMLSTYNLANYLIKNSTNDSIAKDKTHYINICVSKVSYIEKFIDTNKLITKEISASGELPAILSTAASTRGLPSHIIQKLTNEYDNKNILKDRFHQIILPHTFTFSDLKAALGGEPFSSILSKLNILDSIAKSNKIIEQLIYVNSCNDYLEELVVQPATGRLMSRPSVNYQKIMLKHPSVQKELKDIIHHMKN